MAITFEKTPLEWKNSGTEPSTDLKENGFSAGYRPAASTFNYQINNTSECLTELQTKLSDLDQDAIKGIKGNGTTINPSSTGVVNITLSNIGAAASTHYHNANQITSGVLPIERGGTGVTTFDEAKGMFASGIVLYSNESGTTDTTITLSDDISNYKYVEVYYAKQTYTYTSEGERRVSTAVKDGKYPIDPEEFETWGEDAMPDYCIDVAKAIVGNDNTAHVRLVQDSYEGFYQYSDNGYTANGQWVYITRELRRKIRSSTASLIGNTFSHNNWYGQYTYSNNYGVNYEVTSGSNGYYYKQHGGTTTEPTELKHFVDGVYAHTIYAILGYK